MDACREEAAAVLAAGVAAGRMVRRWVAAAASPSQTAMTIFHPAAEQVLKLQHQPKKYTD